MAFLLLPASVASTRSYYRWHAQRYPPRDTNEMNQQLILPCRTHPSSRARFGLPPELLEEVFDHLDRKSILAALKTCKCWKDVAVTMILRLDHRQGRILARKATDSTFFGSHVRHLSVDYSSNDDDWCVDAHAADILSAMPNLRSLIIRGHWNPTEDDPCEGGDGEIKPPWTDWTAERARLLSRLEKSEHLPKLESCTFHYRGCFQNCSHWGLEEHVGVFLNTNIRALKFNHAYQEALNEPIIRFEDQHHANTDLQILILEDCDIDLAAFKKILCFSKALQQVTYTELECWEVIESHHEVKHATAYVEALLSHRKSLETIHFQGLFYGKLGARFGAMEKLKHLDIELGILFGCNNDGRYALNEIPINELLPPTLESLTLRYAYSTSLRVEQMRTTPLRRLLAAKQKFLPRFRKLNLVRERERKREETYLRYEYKGLQRGTKGLQKHAKTHEVNAVFVNVEDFCRYLNVELVDGGFYQAPNTFGGILATVLLKIGIGSGIWRPMPGRPLNGLVSCLA